MRSYVPFDGLWEMPVDNPYSLLVRDDALAWTSGQLALDGASNVLARGDLVAQTRIVCDYISTLLARADLAGDGIGKLMLYHVACDREIKEKMLGLAREHFGETPLLLPVAVPHFYYDDVLLEIDAFATGERGDRTESTSKDGCVSLKLLDAGELVWGNMTISGDCAELPAHALRSLYADALAAFGLSPGHLLREHWFVPGDSARGFSDSRSATDLCTHGLLADPGAAVMIGQSDTRIIGELSFARTGQTTLASHAENTGMVITSRRNGRFLWLCGRHTDGRLNLVQQTTQIMEALHNAVWSHGMDFSDVVKSTAHYVGGNSPHELHDNMAVRNVRYTRPGPASTGLPVYAPADPGARIAIDVLLVSGAQGAV